MSIEFQGLEVVLKALEKPIDQEQLDRTLMRACLLVERSAKEKAQSFADTGYLAGSITSKVEDDQGIVFTPVEYAPYVEYGTGLFAEEGGRKDVPWHYQDDKGEWHTTSGQHPQPYMRPALDENRENIKQILREGLLND
jgi:HK97 gp10 family phage protein